MDNKEYCVYVHTNKKNGKMYVGCTGDNPINRWGHGCNYKGKFAEAIKEFGWDGFTHEVVFDHMDKETALLMEAILIKELNTVKNGYNLSTFSSGSYERNEETLKKMSESHLGKKNSQLHNKHISDAKKGIKLSEETKRKMSKSRKGKPCGLHKKIKNTITGEIYNSVADCCLKNNLCRANFRRYWEENKPTYRNYEYIN